MGLGEFDCKLSPVIKIYEVILNGRQRGATVDLTAV